MYKALGRAACLLALHVQAATCSDWTLAKSQHFEVYSQAGAESATRALEWFQQMRALVEQQTSLHLPPGPPLRVVGFESQREFRELRPHDTADAFYTATETRDYIVMPSLEPGKFGIAAHEYAHAIIRGTGARLPVWLAEGLAELASTASISRTGASYGGELPHHTRTLQRNPMSVAELFRVTPAILARAEREQASRIYAHAWAFTSMLALSPAYQPGFDALLKRIATGTASHEAIRQVYGKAVEAIGNNRNSRRTLRFAATDLANARTHTVTQARADLLLAEVLLASGDLERATAAFRANTQHLDTRAEAFAGLGAAAFRSNDRSAARLAWKQAIDAGAEDAVLCYRYAVLAQAAGATDDEVRPALLRALEIDPAAGDARFTLALMEANASRYRIALDHLQALRVVPTHRAYAYWSTTANALTELGRRKEALEAAATAAKLATTAEQRAHAAQLAFIADTEVTVQFRRDANGKAHLATTRIRRDTPEFNPFIEPGDDIRRVEASLEEIRCGETATGLTIRAGSRLLLLTIIDTSRVLMKDAPAEFTCGPQAATGIMVDYAARAQEGSEGVVRAIAFRQTPTH